MELLQSCTKPSIWRWELIVYQWTRLELKIELNGLDRTEPYFHRKHVSINTKYLNLVPDHQYLIRSSKHRQCRSSCPKLLDVLDEEHIEVHQNLDRSTKISELAGPNIRQSESLLSRLFLNMGITIINIKWSHCILIFIMGVPILARKHSRLPMLPMPYSGEIVW